MAFVRDILNTSISNYKTAVRLRDFTPNLPKLQLFVKQIKVMFDSRLAEHIFCRKDCG